MTNNEAYDAVWAVASYKKDIPARSIHLGVEWKIFDEKMHYIYLYGML